MNGTSTYEGTRIINGVHVHYKVTGFPVGAFPQAAEGSGPVGVVQPANGADAREVVNILGLGIDATIEMMETPEEDPRMQLCDLSPCCGQQPCADVPDNLDEVGALLRDNPEVDSYVDVDRRLKVTRF